MPNTELPAEAKSYIFLFCIYGPIFFVTFAVPSTFAFDSIKGNQIEELVDFIYAHGIDSKEKIDALEENLSIAAERTYARVKTFQWIIATLWALFLYGLNQFTNFALKIAPDQISTTISNNLPTLIIYVVVSLFSVVVIIGYKKSNDAVFRRLQFALQELKYRVASNHTEPT